MTTPASPRTPGGPAAMLAAAVAATVAATLTAACAPAAPPATLPPAPAPAATAAAAAPRRLPNDIRWVRGSAEYRAAALQAYRAAGDRLPELARGHAAGAWAVILDADETVLDNSEYQRRRALVDSGFTEPTWNAWVRERAAAAVPGAVEFLRRVRALGGRVAIVTNRGEAVCDDTRANLRAVGAEADVVLCQPPGAGQSDKNARFRRVQEGTAAPGLGPLAVVAWVGDNIHDFPGLSQAAREDAAALANFGVRWFILPNPMYGSWERLPDR